MKIENLIWSGCSFSAGSAFTSKPNWGKAEENDEFFFAHKDLKKYFTLPYTNKNVKKQIHDLTFPIKLGKKLGIKNTKNLAVGGMGYPIHIRRIMSYLLNNNLDYGKTVVCLQLTSFQRNEVIKVRSARWPENPNGSIEFCWLDGGQGEDHAKHHLIHYYDATYSVMKALYELLFFKGWCESKNIKCHFIGFHGFIENQIMIYLKKYNTYKKQINNQQLCHGDYDFPEIDNLLKELEITELPKILEATFSSQGYHDDSHFSPDGHEKISDILVDIFKNKFGYE